MQDIHSMGGGGGSLFGGGGDRRLRPHHHQAAAAAAATALKCPRCDSLNTKFCYYNNYNLSQPRHFCKSCRRYWTKGGVLRNVPVGGGCRKTKLSNKPKTTPSADSPPAKRSSPNSSSENSIIGGTTAAHSSSENSITRATTEAASAPLHVMPNPSVEATGFLEQDSAVCGVFGEMGNFTSLMGSGDDQGIGIGVGFGFGQQAEGQWRGDEKIMVDQTVGVEVEVGVGGYGPSDWQSGGGDQGLFDLTDTVDHAYWSQTGDHQWSDQVHVQDQQHHHPTDLYNFP